MRSSQLPGNQTRSRRRCLDAPKSGARGSSPAVPPSADAALGICTHVAAARSLLAPRGAAAHPQCSPWRGRGGGGFGAQSAAAPSAMGRTPPLCARGAPAGGGNRRSAPARPPLPPPPKRPRRAAARATGRVARRLAAAVSQVHCHIGRRGRLPRRPAPARPPLPFPLSPSSPAAARPCLPGRLPRHGGAAWRGGCRVDTAARCYGDTTPPLCGVAGGLSRRHWCTALRGHDTSPSLPLLLTLLRLLPPPLVATSPFPFPTPPPPHPHRQDRPRRARPRVEASATNVRPRLRRRAAAILPSAYVPSGCDRHWVAATGARQRGSCRFRFFSPLPAHTPETPPIGGKWGEGLFSPYLRARGCVRGGGRA